MQHKVSWVSRCRGCGSERKGSCAQGDEPHRYCCGREVRTLTTPPIPSAKIWVKAARMDNTKPCWWCWYQFAWTSDDPIGENVGEGSTLRICSRLFRLLGRAGFPDQPRYVLRNPDTHEVWLTYQAAESLIVVGHLEIEHMKFLGDSK
jgi:hypothetical protein